jgi:hypothetical protein
MAAELRWKVDLSQSIRWNRPLKDGDTMPDLEAMDVHLLLKWAKAEGLETLRGVEAGMQEDLIDEEVIRSIFQQELDLRDASPEDLPDLVAKAGFLCCWETERREVSREEMLALWAREANHEGVVFEDWSLEELRKLGEEQELPCRFLLEEEGCLGRAAVLVATELNEFGFEGEEETEEDLYLPRHSCEGFSTPFLKKLASDLNLPSVREIEPDWTYHDLAEAIEEDLLRYFLENLSEEELLDHATSWGLCCRWSIRRGNLSKARMVDLFVAEHHRDDYEGFQHLSFFTLDELKLKAQEEFYECIEQVQALSSNSSIMKLLRDEDFEYEFGEMTEEELREYGVDYFPRRKKSFEKARSKGDLLKVLRKAWDTDHASKSQDGRVQEVASRPRSENRQFWIGVVRPKYYLEEDGSERRDLDPESGESSEGWWTCHKNTQEGDLILLYRAGGGRSDLAYLLIATSDAYSIADEEIFKEEGWVWVCDTQRLLKLKCPITFREIKADPDLDSWGARRKQMQGKVHPVSEEHWEAIRRLVGGKNPDFLSLLARIDGGDSPVRRVLERDVEEALVKNLAVLKQYGLDLELYVDSKGVSGQQYVCRGLGGRIDLLCKDRNSEDLVVVELKIVRATYGTFGQISSYLGWAQNRLSGGKPVRGVVISKGTDPRYDASASLLGDRLRHIDLGEIKGALGLS